MDLPTWILDASLILISIGALAAIMRAAIGPTAADRVVAAELGFIAAVGGLILVAVRLDEPILFDFALIAVLIGFLATIGLARLVAAKSGDATRIGDSAKTSDSANSGDPAKSGDESSGERGS